LQVTMAPERQARPERMARELGLNAITAHGVGELLGRPLQYALLDASLPPLPENRKGIWFPLRGRLTLRKPTSRLGNAARHAMAVVNRCSVRICPSEQLT
jgi:hypothetical protein